MATLTKDELLLRAKLADAIYPQDAKEDVFLQKPLIEAEIKGLLPDAITVTLASVGGTQFAVAVCRDDTWIIFRGTDEVADIMHDINFKKFKPPWALNFKCASGFYKAFEAAIPRVQQLIGSSKNIRILGHSLGGSVALLTGFFLKDGRQSDIIEVTVFCSPRVFDANGVARYNKLLGGVTTLLIDVLDPVPLMPPYSAGYRRTENPVYLSDSRGPCLYEEMSPKERALAFVWGVAAMIKKPGWQGGNEHRLSSVIKKLEMLK